MSDNQTSSAGDVHSSSEHSLSEEHVLENDVEQTAEQATEQKTHFGFKQVEKEKKASLVANVFDSVAAKYDVMNDLMSMGVHRLWKRFTIDCSGVRAGNKVLDIAGGTGDLTAKFSRLVGPTGRVTLADINLSMLQVGRDKLDRKSVV